MEQKNFTLTETAAFLRLHRSTIFKLLNDCTSGFPRGSLIGRKRIFTAEKLTAWLKSKEAK